jgi:hypothetical protein
MMLTFPKPSSWEDLEALAYALVEHHTGPAVCSRYGRNGQAQYGVDILVLNQGSGNTDYVGYQCKNTDRISLKIVKAECFKAKSFRPGLSHFVVVTTAPRDAVLQSDVATIPVSEYGFNVGIWFWEDLNDQLNRSATTAYEYFSRITELAQPAAEATHIAALRRAFDRPAFTDSIFQERDLDELVEALASTKAFMRTGRLYDNRKKHIESVLPHWRCEEKSYRTFCDALMRDLDALYDWVVRNKQSLGDTTSDKGALKAYEFLFKRSALIEKANKKFNDFDILSIPLSHPTNPNLSPPVNHAGP